MKELAKLAFHAAGWAVIDAVDGVGEATGVEGVGGGQCKAAHQQRTRAIADRRQLLAPTTRWSWAFLPSGEPVIDSVNVPLKPETLRVVEFSVKLPMKIESFGLGYRGSKKRTVTV